MYFMIMSAKMANLGLLKITVFLKKGYDVIIPVDDVINKFHDVIYIILQICSCDQNDYKLNFIRI